MEVEIIDWIFNYMYHFYKPQTVTSRGIFKFSWNTIKQQFFIIELKDLELSIMWEFHYCGGRPWKYTNFLPKFIFISKWYWMKGGKDYFDHSCFQKMSQAHGNTLNANFKILIFSIYKLKICLKLVYNSFSMSSSLS